MLCFVGPKLTCSATTAACVMCDAKRNAAPCRYLANAVLHNPSLTYKTLQARQAHRALLSLLSLCQAHASHATPFASMYAQEIVAGGGYDPSIAASMTSSAAVNYTRCAHLEQKTA